MTHFLFQFRRDTTANWASENPVLRAGEPGIDTTTGDLKLGDGVTAWADLDSFSVGGGGGSSDLFAVTDVVFDVGDLVPAYDGEGASYLETPPPAYPVEITFLDQNGDVIADSVSFLGILGCETGTTTRTQNLDFGDVDVSDGAGLLSASAQRFTGSDGSYRFHVWQYTDEDIAPGDGDLVIFLPNGSSKRQHIAFPEL